MNSSRYVHAIPMDSRTRIHIYRRFIDQGLRAISLALDTATEAHHSEAGTLHLLLGTLLVEDGAGSAILRDFRLHTAMVGAAAGAPQMNFTSLASRPDLSRQSGALSTHQEGTP